MSGIDVQNSIIVMPFFPAMVAAVTEQIL